MPSKTQTNGRASKARTAEPPADSRPPGPGRRLADAFDAVERFPVLLESRERVIRAATADAGSLNDLVEAVESDIALTISVLRYANRSSGRARDAVGSVPAAVEMLKPSGVLAIAGTAPVYDFFEPNGGWELRPEHFRVHALAAQRAADSIARAVGFADRDQLAAAALLHDIGRLVIARLHPGTGPPMEFAVRAPEQRVRDERERLGIDHALVGGVLARRWNFPGDLAVAIERHHAEDAEGLPAFVALADMVARYSHGEAVSPDRMRAIAERCGLDARGLRELLYDMPYPRHDAPRVSEPCPLSARELDVLRLLADGKVYKQIAGDMQLSVSTIRTHLHNVYGKIGAVDRAQAVLTARERGWI